MATATAQYTTESKFGASKDVISTIMIYLSIGLYAMYGSKLVEMKCFRDLFNCSIYRLVFLLVLFVPTVTNAPHLAFAIVLFYVITLQLVADYEKKSTMAFAAALTDQLK